MSVACVSENALTTSEGNLRVNSIWKAYLYKLQQEAPSPTAVPCIHPPVECPNYYGEEFHGSISRHECLSLLRQEGSYLIRTNERLDVGQFTLSLRFDGQVKHFRLYYDEEKKHFVGEKAYDSIHDLVADGLVTLYMEAHAGDQLKKMTSTPYSESPHITLTKSMRKQLRSKVRSINSNNCEMPGKQTMISSPDDISDPIVSHISELPVDASASNNTLHSDTSIEPVVDRPHRFCNQTFTGLHWCGFCGHFLWGLMLQGVKCNDCGFKAHRQCSVKVPNDCWPDLKDLQCMFGTDLSTSLKSQSSTQLIPNIVLECVSEVEARGLTMEGIYRVPGSQDHVEALRIAFERDGDKVSLDESTVNDINVVAGVVKLYFRLLPIPLITSQCFNKILDAIKVSNQEARIESTQDALKCLPPAHHATLKEFSGHLARVCEHSAVNKMTATSLSTIFAPTLVQSDAMLEHLQPVDLLALKTSALEPRVIEHLIVHHREIFS